MAIYKLKDLFDFQQGLQIPISEREKSGNQEDKYITIQFLKGDKDEFYIPQARQSVRVSSNDLLIVRTGLTGKPLMGVDGVFHNNFFKLIPKDKDLISIKYFYYWSIKNEDMVFSMASGTTIRDISHKTYGSITVDLPSLEIQNKIIDIIEQNEGIFLRYSNCVRIHSINDAIDDIKMLIDIIEPVELLISTAENILLNINSFIKNMESHDTFYLSEVAAQVKNKPKNIEQISARVMNKRNPSIISLEKRGTYGTNSFFVPEGTLLINTIRSYLEKFAIAVEDADANGTLAMFDVKHDWTSILHTLLNDDFWQQAEQLSHGTKMPVLKNKDIFESIKFRKTKSEIVGIEKIYLKLSKIIIKAKELRTMSINILIK